MILAVYCLVTMIQLVVLGGQPATAAEAFSSKDGFIQSRWTGQQPKLTRLPPSTKHPRILQADEYAANPEAVIVRRGLSIRFAVLPRTHYEWRTSKGEINYRLSAPPRRECRECMEELRSMKLHLDLDGVTLSFGQLPLADHSDVGPPAGSVHFRTSRDRSKLGFGNFRFMPSSLSTTMLETARFRNHFLLEGIMNHGLSSALQRLRTLS